MPRRTALIVAAGRGERAGGELPKQYRPWRGQPMLWHSAQAFAQSAMFDRVVIAIGEGQDAMAQQAVGALANASFVTGGATRRESVLAGLEAIAQMDTPPGRVFIHDAARPGLGSAMIRRLDDALNSHIGAVPALPLVDSISGLNDALLGERVNRDELRRIQTPQAFDFEAILAVHRNWPDDLEATDDAEMMRRAGHGIALVDGDEALAKITFAEDFTQEFPQMPAPQRIFRTGSGFDVHRLVSGEELWLCGIRIDHDKGLSGHSDADVALHAITDAILGAMALGDIGDHFPPSDPQWRGASSDRFLAHAARLIRDAGARIENIDATIICEAPKIGPHRQAMRERIAEILDIPVAKISVKATTTEKLGYTGRKEGIAAEAIATVSLPDGDLDQ
ncbi:MAG: bifunctional 2-C-methyl-D-erythritol 4-phosphate cytidylyltransferase/2-C-methyl-D-erythritol 2,4-cyclodiphosphate synthase [Blastomonas sp.]